MSVFNYWLLCYVPDSARPDRVAVGIVVAGSTPGELAYKYVPRPNVIPALGGSRENFYLVLAGIDEDLQRFAQPHELPLGANNEVFNYMERMRRQNYGVLRVLEPGLVVDTDAETVANKLYNRLVDRPELNEHQPRRLTLLRRAAEETYAEFDVLREKVVTHPALSVKNFRDKVDLAVVSDQVWEISSAFTFGNADKAVQDRIRSWSYTMAKVRSAGGLIEPKNGKPIEVAANVPIRAVIEKPESKKQEELYLKVQDEWDDVGVETVFKDSLKTHAARLNRKLELVA
ncbi:DUF3037 domain-containing protein [Rothia nasimurium]|uniref:DUF3037 domain-containing protein n=1 Tax=Rothia nasimurium TaxID=85336 RepID=UPI001F3DF42F|nr:DUF3037 domain-containing protein [Rothia nasimurium]